MKRIISLILITFMLSGSIAFASPVLEYKEDESASVFQRTSVTKVIVTASALNVRSGPGTYYKAIAVVYRGQILRVIGESWGWYVVYLPNYQLGYVSSLYVKPYPTPTPTPTPAPTPTPTPTPTPAPAPSTGVTSEMQQMLNLINTERAKVGVAALKFDTLVNKVALTKAQDMVAKNYFSHTSPTYGSPFDMMRQFGVTFKSAGENLAGNSSVTAAHTALMNSSGHRANILNASFNYIGIGIQPSSTYGKIFVQMFIGR